MVIFTKNSETGYLNKNLVFGSLLDGSGKNFRELKDRPLATLLVHIRYI